jgi:transposase
MTPLYGWGEKHVRVEDYVPDVRFKRKSLISVFGLSGFRASMVFKGTLNGEVFEYYVSEVLVHALDVGDVLVLDNLSVHKVRGVLDPLVLKGVKIVFLPVYSPDLNPIELAWSKVKTMLRKLKSKTEGELQKALLSALKWVSAQDSLNYFKHCGYASI